MLAAFLGWVFANLSVHFCFEHLDDLLAAAGGVDSTPSGLVDEWQNDGAKRVFVYLFGWAYGLVCLAPWSAVYFVASAIRRARLLRATR